MTGSSVAIAGADPPSGRVRRTHWPRAEIFDQLAHRLIDELLFRLLQFPVMPDRSPTSQGRYQNIVKQGFERIVLQVVFGDVDRLVQVKGQQPLIEAGGQ